MGVDQGLAARRAALRAIKGVLEDGEMIDPAQFAGKLDAPDRARALTLARETLRRLGAADALIARFAKKPPKGIARDALRLGVVEMLALGAAPHGVVDAMVSLTHADRRGAAAAGFVNAVLRKVADEGAEAWSKLDHARLSCPDEAFLLLKADWGRAVARRILAAQLEPPPLDLTVKSDPEGWAKRLGGEVTPTGSVRLRRPGAVTALEGYESGEWWVQDAAAALPARLAGTGDGRALDLCAAPGGKTLQLAAAGWSVTALDASHPRMARLEENLGRAKLEAELVVADALDWRGDAFDLVLLDAPCSATGTVRRHPELPHLRDEEGIAARAALQRRLLDAAWRLVKPGGRLIYCVCSLTKDEGEAQAARFFAETEDASRIPVDPALIGDAALVDGRGDLRTRPDQWAEIGGLDGFFAFHAQRSA